MKHLCIILLSITLWASCSRSQDKQATGEDIASRLEDIDPRAKGGNTCLLAYATKYDELLTADMVTGAAGVSPESVSAEYSRTAKNPKYHELTYSWEGTRKKTIGGMTFPVRDIVKLSGIAEISLFTFRSAYRVVSEEETRQANTSMEQAIDGGSGNARVNESLKKLEEMGVSKEEQKKMMESLTASAKKASEGFSAVDQLGDTAMWNSRTNTLYVFRDGAMFEIVSEHSDPSKNREVAIALAKGILKKCK